VEDKITMFSFIGKIILSALGLLLIAHYTPGIVLSSFSIAIIVAIIFGILSVTVKPVLVLLTLPINLITFGLFTFVINAFLFWFVASFVQSFAVEGFIAAFLGAFLFSVLSWVIDRLL